MAGKHERLKNSMVRKAKRRAAKKTALIAVIAVIGAAAVFVAAAGVAAGAMDNIYPNVSVNGVKVGGMTLKQAETAFDRMEDRLRSAAAMEHISWHSVL